MRTKPRRLGGLFFALVLLPFLCAFPYVRALNNPNELVRVYTVMALVTRGTFCIDQEVETFGWVNDMARVKGKDGVERYFMVKAPGVLYAGVPGYVLFSRVVAPLLGKEYPVAKDGHPPDEEDVLWWVRMSTWSMRLLGSQLPCLLFLVLLERYLRAFSCDAILRYTAVAAVGLGTNYLAYAHMFASHSHYAIVAFCAFATIERELRRGEMAGGGGSWAEQQSRQENGHGVERPRTSRAALAGFLTSACVALEYQALFMTVVLSLFALYVFWSPRRPLDLTRLLAFAAGGLLNVPHVMYFQHVAYGNAFTPGHKLLETAKFATEHRMGLWGILWPSWDRIQSLAIDPGFGFFGMSPFMWLGLLGVPLLMLLPGGAPTARAHVRRITFVWFACMVAVFAVNAGFVEWRAGWTVGPRYLVVCGPFFAFGATLALERLSGRSRLRRALARGVGGGLALSSVITIGTVGLVVDTLPDTIRRPFAQFALPMARAGMVPHHVGEWFGWTSTTLWYVACGALLFAPVMLMLAVRGERRPELALRAVMFVGALAIGMLPALSRPNDESSLYALHPSTTWFAERWEPEGRDRTTRLRQEALGRGSADACLWYLLADLDRSLNRDALASTEEARALSLSPRARCPRSF